MNATKVKSLAPLYGGVALLVIAVAGAALSLLSGNEGREKDPLDTGSVKPMPPVVPPVVPQGLTHWDCCRKVIVRQATGHAAVDPVRPRPGLIPPVVSA